MPTFLIVYQLAELTIDRAEIGVGNNDEPVSQGKETLYDLNE
ncbi:MAG: hypothetical protein ACXVDF_17155 [Ktedonobacterales bacterium]